MTIIIPLVREARTSEDGQEMTGMTGCVSLKKILLDQCMISPQA